MNKIEWHTGLNDFKRHTLTGSNFNTHIIDQEFEPNRPLDVIIYDSLRGFSKTFQVLYSGGLDSELIMKSLLKHRVNVTAVTLIITVDDLIINTHDLYYAEKFCRENNVQQTFYTLNANEFYPSGEYESYLTPYNIVQPHVASHFWLIEKCSEYALIGGDWPWIQCDKTPRLISPYKIDYSSYERFMKDKKIEGCGNALSCSFELAYNLSKNQLNSSFNTLGKFIEINRLKIDMFKLDLEPRIKSYGWEGIPDRFFNIYEYRMNLLKKIGIINNSISWGDKYKALINSTVTSNDTF